MPNPDKQRLLLLESLFAAFNRHDAADVMACMTDDIVFETAAGPEAYGRRITGAAAVKAAFEQVWTDLPDVSWTCSAHTVSGDRGLSEWVFRGTQPSGARIEAEGCDIFIFRGDKISSKRAFRKDRPPVPPQKSMDTAAS